MLFRSPIDPFDFLGADAAIVFPFHTQEVEGIDRRLHGRWRADRQSVTSLGGIMSFSTGLHGLVSLVMGALLGAGLYVSGMSDPGKVLGFLDVLGPWNPALMGVLGGAVIISLIGFQSLPQQMSRPWLESQFYVPTRRDVDRPLVVGTLLFGIGWGLVGYCPGPALAGLALGNGEAPIFLLAMLAGGVVQKRWEARNK